MRFQAKLAFLLIFAILAGALLMTARTGAASTDAELKERFYYEFYEDLGPSTVDISRYPPRQQENRRVFARTCSRCHTLARPLNAPIVKLQDWESLIHRMHRHSKAELGTAFSKEQASEIADFLAYDANVRKVGSKTFDQETQTLKKRFAGLQAERTAFLDQQLKQQFYYDLGPAGVDVSSYPKEERQNYAVFSQVCSRCHSLARPLNAPMVSRQEWEDFILRMHKYSKMVPGTEFSLRDAAAIADFLSYDSQVRKVEGKRDFDERSRQLKQTFSARRVDGSKRPAPASARGKPQP